MCIKGLYIHLRLTHQFVPRKEGANTIIKFNINTKAYSCYIVQNTIKFEYKF